MKNKRKGNFVFYTFWLLILLLSSTTLGLILVRILPDFSLFQGQQMVGSEKDSQETMNSKEKMTETPNTPPPEDMDMASSTETMSNSSEIQDVEDTTTERTPLTKTDPSQSQPRLEPRQVNRQVNNIRPMFDPIFINAIFTNTSQFINTDGSEFEAGTVTVEKMYPNDFTKDQMIDTNPIPVIVSFTVGWKNLQNFSMLEEEFNKKFSRSIALPPTMLLSVKVDVANSASAVSSDQLLAMEKVVTTHLEKAFNTKNIPENIETTAQQRLAASYVAYGYPNIVLVSNN